MANRAKQALSFCQRNGGGEGRRFACICFFVFLFFLELKVPTVCQALPTLSFATQLRRTIPAIGANQRTVESTFTLPSRIPSYCLAIPISPTFWETPVQLNSVKRTKKKERFKDLFRSFFLCWVQCCIFLCFVKALVFKWRVSSKKGSATKAKLFFLFCSAFLFKGKEPFLS